MYIGIPLVLEFTPYSLLGYRGAPHEFFRQAEHDVLSTRHVCRSDECDDIPDVWKDRRTAAVYRYTDFTEHRAQEALSLALRWFIYGLIACLGGALYRERFNRVPFFQTMGYSVIADAALATIIYFQVLS